MFRVLKRNTTEMSRPSIKGVFQPHPNLWKATITVNGVLHSSISYPTQREAVEKLFVLRDAAYRAEIDILEASQEEFQGNFRAVVNKKFLGVYSSKKAREIVCLQYKVNCLDAEKEEALAILDEYDLSPASPISISSGSVSDDDWDEPDFQDTSCDPPHFPQEMLLLQDPHPSPFPPMQLLSSTSPNAHSNISGVSSMILQNAKERAMEHDEQDRLVKVQLIASMQEVKVDLEEKKQLYESTQQQARDAKRKWDEAEYTKNTWIEEQKWLKRNLGFLKTQELEMQAKLEEKRKQLVEAERLFEKTQLNIAESQKSLEECRVGLEEAETRVVKKKTKYERKEQQAQVLGEEVDNLLETAIEIQKYKYDSAADAVTEYYSNCVFMPPHGMARTGPFGRSISFCEDSDPTPLKTLMYYLELHCHSTACIAAQFGSMVRAAIITLEEDTLLMVNPSFLPAKNTIMYPCSDTNSEGVTSLVQRFETIVVSYLDENLNKNTRVLSKRDACLVQLVVEEMK